MTDNTQQSGDATLEVTDIQNAIKIIDYACEQGAFKGWNVVTQVYSVRNRLTAFVDQVNAAESAAEGVVPTPEVAG